MNVSTEGSQKNPLSCDYFFKKLYLFLENTLLKTFFTLSYIRGVQYPHPVQLKPFTQIVKGYKVKGYK